MEIKKSSLGMEANIAAGLAYVVGWVTGLIFFLLEKESEFVKFHAAQSLITFGVLFILGSILGFVVGMIPLIGLLVAPLLGFLLWMVSFVLWIVCLIQAFQGKWFEIPIVAPYAKKLAGLEGAA